MALVPRAAGPHGQAAAAVSAIQRESAPCASMAARPLIANWRGFCLGGLFGAT
jgi:hypothetical protein